MHKLVRHFGKDIFLTLTNINFSTVSLYDVNYELEDIKRKEVLWLKFITFLRCELANKVLFLYKKGKLIWLVIFSIKYLKSFCASTSWGDHHQMKTGIEIRPCLIINNPFTIYVMAKELTLTSSL
jgi:hypothetical protein